MFLLRLYIYYVSLNSLKKPNISGAVAEELWGIRDMMLTLKAPIRTAADNFL